MRTLAGVESDAFVLLRRERRARREQDLPVRPLDGLVELTLRELDGIGEREDDGARVELGHEAHNLLIECALFTNYVRIAIKLHYYLKYVL